jgi:hypothetical protein
MIRLFGFIGFLICCVFLRHYWWLFLSLGLVLTVVSYAVQVPKLQIDKEPDARERRMQMKPNSVSPFVIPKEWDPSEVGIQLRRLQHDQPVLKIFVDAVINRFITKQDHRLAKRRIDFLRTLLEELGLRKEFQGSLDELEFRKIQLEIKRLKLETEKEGVQSKRKKQHEILELEHKRDLLKIEVDISVLEREKAELDKRADFLEEGSIEQKPREKSAEEIRSEKEAKLNEEIRTINESDQIIEQNMNMSDAEKMRRKNINEKRRNKLFDELERL